MSRRRIWLIIIGILIAGVSATWAMEKFVSSHGVNTAAVVGFEASAIQPDAGSPENPYMAENWMKMAENAPESTSEADTGVSTAADYGLVMEDREKEMAEEELAVNAADDTAAAVDVETVKSPLEPDHAGTGKPEETPVTVYTRSDLEERLEAVRSETEKYQDDQAASQPSWYAAAEYVRNLWDRELNLIYSSIHGEMDDAAAEAFRREEIEWIKKRDLAADKAGTKSTGTPVQSIEYVRTSASVTMDRCYELLENYGDYLESDKN